MRFLLVACYVVIAVLTSSGSSVTRISAAADEAPLKVDVAALTTPLEHWTLIDQSIGKTGGWLRGRHNKWLMYFLHWRPLDESRKDLTPEYARRTLLNFWGPNMAFTVTGREGALTVAGHPARFVEGDFRGVVATRFIIWNCPESGRQLIADTNINLALNTPPALLELQRQVTDTVVCHRAATAVQRWPLARTVSFPTFGFSFLIPETWRTREFPAQRWFPKGLSPVEGTLWTLPTDSDKRIELAWARQETPLDATNLRERLVELFRPFLSESGKTTVQVRDISLERVTEAAGVLLGQGRYTWVEALGEQKDACPFVFRAAAWQRAETVYVLAASLAARDSFWNIPNDLAPTPEVLDEFWTRQVLPHVSGAPRVLRSARWPGARGPR